MPRSASATQPSCAQLKSSAISQRTRRVGIITAPGEKCGLGRPSWSIIVPVGGGSSLEMARWIGGRPTCRQDASARGSSHREQRLRRVPPSSPTAITTVAPILRLLGPTPAGMIADKIVPGRHRLRRRRQHTHDDAPLAPAGRGRPAAGGVRAGRRAVWRRATTRWRTTIRPTGATSGDVGLWSRVPTTTAAPRVTAPPTSRCFWGSTTTTPVSGWWQPSRTWVCTRCP